MVADLRARAAFGGDVAALAPLLGLFVAVALIAAPPGHPVADEGPLIACAHRLLHGEYALPHTQDAVSFLWHGPGTPLMLAPLVAAGLPLVALRLTGPLLAFAAVVAFERLLRTRLPRRGALAGAYALGLYAPLWTTLAQIHKEPLALLLAVLATLWLVRHLDTGAARYAVLAGLAFAALTMVRLEYGWVVIAMLATSLAWLLRSHATRRPSEQRPGVHARRTAAVFAIALAGCAPWLAYTGNLTGRPLYWGNSGGSSLYWMSPTQGRGETGQWHAVHTVFASDRLAAYRPLFTRLARLTPLDRDLRLQRLATRDVRAHPLSYARNLLANGSRLLFDLPFWPTPAAGMLLLYGISNALLLAACARAAFLVARRRRRLPRAALPVAAFAGWGLLVHLPPAADPRMLIPLVPALILLAALARARPAPAARSNGAAPAGGVPAPAPTRTASPPPERVAVLGGGPAGLTAAYALAKAGVPVVVVEAEDQVGGLAKTVVRDGYRFDLGGHRFFTKSTEVEALWHEVLGEELLRRPRMSRIYWRGRFLDYPLRGPDVIRKLGPVELTRCSASYLRAALRRTGGEESLEDWVSRRFGRRLFELFFRSYTEKVWGVPTSDIRAEWAAQRIKGLSFVSAARAAFAGNGDNRVKSLISEFEYPRLGPGQMWERMAERVEELGGEVRLGAPVAGLRLDGAGGAAVELAGGETIRAAHVISSLPLRSVVEMATPAPPAEVIAAAAGLRYRDFLTVALVIEGDDVFPDNWIYIHDPSVRVGRIQNYRSWSPAMVPDPATASVGLEYFCFEGDDLWSMLDGELVALATREIVTLGLARATSVRNGHVVRVPKAYPIYDGDYADRIQTIRSWLDGVAGLQQVGRNGLHRYNNSDHSSLTALRAVDNMLEGAGHDIWAVNADSAYHEEDVPDEHPYARAPEPALAQAVDN